MMTPLRSNLRRRGVFLIEMLVTITVLMVLLGLGASLLHLVLRLDQAGRDAFDIAADQARLGQTFRQDVRQASAEPAPDLGPDHLALILPDDRRVDYSIRPHDLLREVRDGAKVRQREVYRRPARSSARFERLSEAGRPLIALIIDRRPHRAETDSRIEAEVGRLDRLSGRSR